MKRPTCRRRGSAMLEFALASAVLVPAMVGTFQYGYSFYLYNQLEAAVANAACYGAARTYKSSGGAADVDKGKNAIRNMLVYGAPSPAVGAKPVVLGLEPSHVTVEYTLGANGLPTKVAVSISNFTIDALFNSFTFYGKPYVEYPFNGRFAPNESEP